MTRSERLALTVEEAAQRIGVSRGHLYPLLLSNPPAIRSVKIGRRRVIPVTALEDYLAREMAASDTESAASFTDRQRSQGNSR